MSTRYLTCALTFLAAFAASTLPAFAQGGGSFGGAGAAPARRDAEARAAAGDAALPAISPERALNVIAIQGSAEMRVKPEGLRLVLAVLSEGATAEECQTVNDRKLAAVRERWKAGGIAEVSIVEDFIAVLPRYTWKEEPLDKTNALVQRLGGYRMQTNLHVTVKTEAEAMICIRQAFTQGVSDIIAFDYWSSELDAKKREARAQALAAAKEKADVLLTVFAVRPPPINVEEHTEVYFPQSQYVTFTNSLEETVEYDYRSNSLPRVRAIRPQMTFFNGLRSNADVSPGAVALHPEIAVTSTVRISYQSPATKSVPGVNMVR